MSDEKLTQEHRKFLKGCKSGPLLDIRDKISKVVNLQFTSELIVELLQERNLDPRLRLGASRALVAMLPGAMSEFEKVLGLHSPRGIHETHFAMFGDLDRQDFTEAERYRIEGALVNYLRNTKSNAGYSAWKAGWVLGGSWISEITIDTWYSERNRNRLSKLLFEARFAAGRSGAIEAYKSALKKQKLLTEEDLRPLREVARSDRSKNVRDDALFALKSKLRA